MFNNQEKAASMAADISTFLIGDAVLGINILAIQEINKPLEITKVPLSTDTIDGVMNLRGNIVTVLNTGKILGLPGLKERKDQRIIIVDSKGEYVGLIVDAIGDVVQADKNDIKPPPPNIDHLNKDYFHGVLEKTDSLIGILDTDKLIGA